MIEAHSKADHTRRLRESVAGCTSTDSSCKACAGYVMKDLECLSQKMKERLGWSDTDILGAILTFLDTQTWFLPALGVQSVLQGCIDSNDEKERNDNIMERVLDATDLLSAQFGKPLEAKHVNLIGLVDELEEMVL